ncbi:hypothetical protein ABIB49_003077 [Arthrobacter sp. UYCu512]|uniref:hypothetical protein n=1 Tax=Arthrobacter sp. UYCu512 TaxID=3156338 RepID=UPI003398A378
MITTIDPGRYFHVTGATAATVQDGITHAVQTAQEHSMREGWQGILVTRHHPGLYTVALSAEVPYGLIIERDGAAGSIPAHSQQED